MARILNKARLEARSRPVFGLDMTIVTMVKQSGMDLLYNYYYCFSALMNWQAPVPGEMGACAKILEPGIEGGFPRSFRPDD